jgi:hypothetical protein
MLLRVVPPKKVYKHTKVIDKYILHSIRKSSLLKIIKVENSLVLKPY